MTGTDFIYLTQLLLRENIPTVYLFRLSEGLAQKYRAGLDLAPLTRLTNGSSASTRDEEGL